MHSAHVDTHIEDKNFFEHRGQSVWNWLRSNQRFESSTTFSRMAVQSSTASSDRFIERTRGVQAKKAWSNETRRVEDAHSPGMAENGTTSYPQSTDSRQSDRLHDGGHDPRETDQVWTCSEFARINLRTATSVSLITEILTVLMNTVNSFENHRLTARQGLMIHHSLPLQTVLMKPPNADSRATCRCAHTRR